MTDMENTITYKAGVFAYSVGLSIDSCSFEDKQIANVWRKGWRDAEAKMRRSVDKMFRNAMTDFPDYKD